MNYETLCNNLKDEEISLHLEKVTEPVPEKRFVLAFSFDIYLLNGNKIGYIIFRAGHNEKTYIGGNIGYEIEEPYRGHHYAKKACEIVFDLARSMDFTYLYITCLPNNIPSRKTILSLSGQFINTVPIPENDMMYIEGKRFVDVFKILL